MASALRRWLFQVGSLYLQPTRESIRNSSRYHFLENILYSTLYVLTLGFKGAAGGEGDGEAWPTELWAGLELFWLLLFWSSGLSSEGDEPGCLSGVTLLTVSPVVSFGVSMATDDGDKR